MQGRGADHAVRESCDRARTGRGTASRRSTSESPLSDEGAGERSAGASARFRWQPRVLQLPSALADAHGLPRGDRFRRQPQGDVASLDQCSVVRRPVSDAVFRFVPGTHSRLHVESMPLRPSRWPGPRRTLVTAHQRPVFACDVNNQYLNGYGLFTSGPARFGVLHFKPLTFSATPL